MAKVSDIFEFIDSFAPFESAMDFDNVGVLVGDKNAEVKRCLVALDVTNSVINEAKLLKATLIISHHSVIFNAIKTLSINSIPYALAQNEISVICAHTNLDMAPFGVNTCLAKALSLRNLKALSYYDSGQGALPMGLVGELERDFWDADFAEFVKFRLNCAGIRYTNLNKTIRKVAVCSGAGGDLIDEAIGQNVDAFVTGEIKHHEILSAVKNGICVVDVGHFKSEDIVIAPLVEKLSERFKNVEFFKSKTCTDTVEYI